MIKRLLCALLGHDWQPRLSCENPGVYCARCKKDGWTL